MKQGNIVSPGQPEQKTLKTPKTKLNEPKKKNTNSSDFGTQKELDVDDGFYYLG